VAQEVLGKDASDELISQMTGQNYDCLCLSCLSQFEIDIDKEIRDCPSCHSNQVRTVLELTDRVCPTCKVGTIVQEDMGIEC
jgi:hypothetical protein